MFCCFLKSIKIKQEWEKNHILSFPKLSGKIEFRILLWVFTVF